MPQPGLRSERYRTRCVAGCVVMHHLFSRRAAEEAPEVRCELTRAHVADGLRSDCDASLFGRKESAGLKKSKILLVLDRRAAGERMEMPSERRRRHMH